MAEAGSEVGEGLMFGYDCGRDYEFDKALEDLWRQADDDILSGMRERSDLDPDESHREKGSGRR